MSEKEIRVLYVQPGKYPEERTIPNTLKACRNWSAEILNVAIHGETELVLSAIAVEKLTDLLQTGC